MSENELAKVIVDVAYHIHVRLGPGLLESVYEAILVHELQKRGPVRRGSSGCSGGVGRRQT
jgi:GxxExxY protein